MFLSEEHRVLSVCAFVAAVISVGGDVVEG
jgi:hypothetical protein